MSLAHVRRYAPKALLLQYTKPKNVRSFSNLTSKSASVGPIRANIERTAFLRKIEGSSFHGTFIFRDFSRRFSGRHDDQDDNDDYDDNSSDDEYDNLTDTKLPTTFNIPDIWPRVPVIACKRSPIFPKFMKLFEVSVYGCNWIPLNERYPKFLDAYFNLFQLTCRSPTQHWSN